MFEKLKFKRNKDNPEKLLELFEAERDLRKDVMERLFELKHKKSLLYLAKNYRKYRNQIVSYMAENMDIDAKDCREILSWLHVSRYHKSFIEFVVYKFNNRIIRDYIDDENIDSISKVTLKKVWQRKRKERGEDLEDDDFLKLKMWYDESGFSQDSISSDRGVEEIFKEKLEIFLNKVLSFSKEEEVQFIKMALIELYESDPENYLYSNILLDLSKIKLEEKIKICQEIYPFNQANYMHYFIKIGFKILKDTDFQAFFHNAIFKKIIVELYSSNINAFLYYIYKKYITLKWLKKFIPNFDAYDKLDKIIEIKDVYFLKDKYNFSIMELCRNSKIRKALAKTSHRLIDTARKSINADNKNYKEIIRLLHIIGGKANFKFHKELLNRDIVGNIQEVREKINKQYLKLKMEIQDKEKLKEILKTEEKEKSSVISKEQYSYIANYYFEYLNKKEVISEHQLEYIKKYAPNFEKYIYNSDNYGKISLVKFIAKYGLNDYLDLIKPFAEEDNILSIITNILLIKNEETDPSKLKTLIETQDIEFKREIADSVNESYPNEIIFALYYTENPHIIKILLKNVLKLSLERQKIILKEFFKKTSNHLKPLIADILGQRRNPFYIPYLIELLKNGDTKSYQSVIINLSEIDHPMSLKVLNNMKIEPNQLLIIERAKAYIKLGKKKGWKILNAYVQINDSYLTFYVKKYIIELSSGDNLFMLTKFLNDSNIKISIMALGKFLLYDEKYGKSILNSKFLNNNNETLFFLSVLLKNFDINDFKEILAKIFYKDSYAAKTIIAIHFLEHHESKFFNELSSELRSLSNFELIQVLQALKEFPHVKTLPWLKHMYELKDENLIDDINEAIINYDFNDFFPIISNVWQYFDDELRPVLAQVFWKIDDIKVIHYLNKLNLDDYELFTKIELAFALVKHGKKEGWDVLENIIQKEMVKYKAKAIERISSLKSIAVLNKLKTYLRTPDVKLQEIVLKAIGETSLSEGIKYLEKYISSNNSNIRLIVAKALTQIPHRRSYEKLKFLVNDENNLVKMTAEIGRSKFNNLIVERRSFSKELERVFREKENYTSIHNIDFELERIKSEYENVPTQKLYEFANKVIVSKEEFDEKTKGINKKLKESMVNCNDADKIVELKQKAEKEIGKIISIQNLAASILKIEEKDIEKSKKVIETVINSGKEDLVKILLFAASEHNSRKWDWAFYEILSKYDEHSLISLIFYAIHNRKDSSLLPLYIRLSEFDNAKYLLVYWFLYFFIKQKGLKVVDIKKSKTLLEEMVMTKETKSFIRDLLNKLVSIL